MQSEQPLLDPVSSHFGRKARFSSRPELLLVDDDPDHLQLFKLFLESAGYIVKECSNSQDALKIATSRRIDILITDIMMPEFDGLSLIYELRRSLPDKRRIPIIALTATRHDIEEHVLRLNGPDMLCMKSMALHCLLPQIEFLLENWTVME